MCNLTTGEKRVVMAMMKTFEPILGSDYDFSPHKKIEKEVNKSLKNTS
jgi:hypothetical protein